MSFFMRNNKGFSLTEVLVTIGILSIMGSIATVTYRGYDLGIEKRNLRQAGRYFALAVGNCVTAAGGWIKKRPGFYDHDGDSNTPEIHSMSAETMYPCRPDGVSSTPVQITGNIETELKKILDYECPGDECHIMSRDDRSETKYRYYCLDIRKTVQGKNLQLFVNISMNNPSNYEVLCRETENFFDLHDLYCKKTSFAKQVESQSREREGKTIKGGGFKPCKWGKKEN